MQHGPRAEQLQGIFGSSVSGKIIEDAVVIRSIALVTPDLSEDGSYDIESQAALGGVVKQLTACGVRFADDLEIVDYDSRIADKPNFLDQGHDNSADIVVFCMTPRLSPYNSRNAEIMNRQPYHNPLDDGSESVWHQAIARSGASIVFTMSPDDVDYVGPSCVDQNVFVRTDLNSQGQGNRYMQSFVDPYKPLGLRYLHACKSSSQQLGNDL